MKVEERMLRDMGETYNVELAGYLLPDGTLVNFSYDGIMRTEDHRYAGVYFRKKYGTEALIEMMRRGNIRVMCSSSHYGFEFIKKPTLAQKRVMQQTYTKSNKLGRWFNIDVSNNAGRIQASYEDTYFLMEV